uniref:Uncharacterized protein n=1 Tax=Setaria viridis TaxID=4556 RepID=A0A4U6UJC7_SETVI|nr:hypothetical protein SEVIR_5G216650v2 [Setaria viridis]
MQREAKPSGGRGGALTGPASRARSQSTGRPVRCWFGQGPNACAHKSTTMAPDLSGKMKKDSISRSASSCRPAGAWTVPCAGSSAGHHARGCGGKCPCGGRRRRRRRSSRGGRRRSYVGQPRRRGTVDVEAQHGERPRGGAAGAATSTAAAADPASTCDGAARSGR